MKISLTGGGTGSLLFAREPLPGDGFDVGLILLENTGLGSILTITTSGAGSATTVGGIEVRNNASLGTITGKTASLNGTIAVPGLLGAVTMDDALAGSSIDVNANLLAPATTQLALTLDRVTDTSVNTHNEPVTSITASCAAICSPVRGESCRCSRNTSLANLTGPGWSKRSTSISSVWRGFGARSAVARRASGLYWSGSRATKLSLNLAPRTTRSQSIRW